jgi:hypothetical protein
MDLLLEAKLTPDQQKEFDQALAILKNDTLDEGIMDKLKKLGLSATVIAALLASPQLTQAQKEPLKDLSKQSTVSSTINKSTSVISPQEKQSWDSFQKWLVDKGYAGNAKMDENAFRMKVLNQYKKETGINAPDTNFVKKLQQYQIDSRNQIIKDVESDKAKIAYDYKTKGWEGFQPEVLSMEKSGGIDGKIGKETSKYKFRIWLNKDKIYTVPGELDK